MRLVEIRDLDGPNIFLLQPAIKIEFALESDDDEAEAVERVRAIVPVEAEEIGAAWVALSDFLHEQAGLDAPDAVVTPLEEDDHVAFAFGWRQRRVARRIGRSIAAITLGESFDLQATLAEIDALKGVSSDDDRPEMIRDSERRVPAVGITGTNGKTTTTRLIAHIVHSAGKRPGWCSTAGVFIDGEPVLDGDYTGPAGARRVLLDEAVDVAVLETARGGILLRGLGYESNDVSVFTNISADHLGLLGVLSVEGLAAVKSTVIAVTNPSGFAVLNAEDSLVWAMRGSTRAKVVAVSSHARADVIEPHLAGGGAALIVENGQLIWKESGQSIDIVPVVDIPITYGGRAIHMLENAICAAAAAKGLGFSPETIAEGLRTFASSSATNPGRLNAYRVNDAVVLLDYAHNEAGLTHLLNLAGNLIEGEGIVRAVIGAAGDRTDESIREMARIAGERAQAIYIRETAKYLRGRSSNAELNQLYLDGLASIDTSPVAIFSSELEAVKAAVGDALPGDVVVSMSYEQSEASRDWLLEIGAVAIS